jgi:hypothetical protein
MFYCRTTVDALMGRTKRADVIVLRHQPRKARRAARRAKCKVIEFRPARASARQKGGDVNTRRPRD